MTKRFTAPANLRRGMTLIEVLASLLLMSLLLGILWGLVPKFAATAQDNRDWAEVQDAAWAHMLLTGLALDLKNTSSAQVNSSQLQLSGRLARDPSTGNMIDQPGQRNYLFIPWRDRTLLIVEQAGSPTLCGVGHFSIVLQPISEDGSEPTPVTLGGESIEDRQELRLLALPNQMKIGVRGEDGTWLALQTLHRVALVTNPRAQQESLR